MESKERMKCINEMENRNKLSQNYEYTENRTALQSILIGF